MSDRSPVLGIWVGANLFDPFKKDIEKMVDEGIPCVSKRRRQVEETEQLRNADTTAFMVSELDVYTTYVTHQHICYKI